MEWPWPSLTDPGTNWRIYRGRHEHTSPLPPRTNLFYFMQFLPPANEVWGKVIFLHQFVILFTGGRVWLLGGHAWLLRGVACVVAPGGAWVVAPWGGMHACSRGCVVAPGGVRGCSGGACVVALGERVWLLWGGHGWDTTTHGDTVNERAVRILLECILVWDKCLQNYMLVPPPHRVTPTLLSLPTCYHCSQIPSTMTRRTK